MIGGILVHQRKFNDVAEFLTAEDFYHPALRAIYEAMIELDANSKPIDALTVVVEEGEMKNRGARDASTSCARSTAPTI